jgi:N-acetylglucosamine-6-phosphate deacetylase
MRTLIVNGMLLTPFESRAGCLVIDGAHIGGILPAAPPPNTDDVVIDADGMWVAPGLIDVHTHGSAGHDTMHATPEAVRGMARFQAMHGVTSYLPTTVSASSADLRRVVENAPTWSQPEDGAQPMGLHLEGPYLNADHRGAQPAELLRPPDPTEYEAWLDSGVVRLITVAPELPGAMRLIEQGVARSVEFAVGHSGASFEVLAAAADRGLRQATHTFNGMPGLHHREPGTVGGVLADERIYAQVIADGVHVHPAVVRILVRAKGPERVILITDATQAAGLSDGEYELAGQPIRVRHGVARTLAGGLAGSTITLDAALRNIVGFAGVSVPEAVRMATATPAEAMGWGGRKGVLASGADADVVLLDKDLAVQLTMVAGRVVYRPEKSG